MDLSLHLLAFFDICLKACELLFEVIQFLSVFVNVSLLFGDLSLEVLVLLRVDQVLELPCLLQQDR